MIDTEKEVETLTDAGLARPVATAIVRLTIKAADEVVTKDQLAIVLERFERRFDTLETKMGLLEERLVVKIEQIEGRINGKIGLLEERINGLRLATQVTMGGVIGIFAATTIAVLKIAFKL